MNQTASLVLRDRLPIGTFTIVRESDARRITLRVRECPFYARNNYGERYLAGPKVIAEFLSGPDNEADYTGFAFVDPATGDYTIWSKQKRGEAWFRWALDVLRGDPLAAGQAWARESRRCWRCGRLLTTPESVDAGIGPDCARAVAA